MAADDLWRRLFDGGFEPFARAEIEQSIPGRFARQVDRFADRLAVKDPDRALTYRELDAAANRLAQVILAARGAGSEPVAFLHDQGVAAATTILGILKAGKIYVALEPSQPRVELARIVADCAPGLLLSDDKYLHLAAELASAPEQCLNVDAVAGDAAAGDGRDADPDLDIAPDAPAYIFYTSGSTGTPKGVVDCHRNVLHNVMRYTNALSIGAEDRLSLVQSCAFSGTVSSLFCALANGAAVFPFDLRNAGIGRLAEWLRHEEISIFHSVPVIFEQLMAAGGNFPHFRIIRLEGDQAHMRHVTLYRARFDARCVLANGLGATETGIVRQFFITPGTDLSRDVVPIGHAVEDMEVGLLDEAGAPALVGAVGEIAVRSRYLASGYWRRPELTAAAFASDPEDPEMRTYRTGDLGQMSPDGCLEFMGRKDFRRKLRGRWIDVAEIEAALAARASMAAAAVLVREDRPGAERLVAYVVPASLPPPTVGALRRELLARLPEIMVPARFVFLDALPLDPNGKVHLGALPPPGRARPELDEPFVPPESAKEKAVAAAFCEVLELDQVGRNDDFFALGGDSLQAAELMILIEDRLGAPCGPDFFLGACTVAAAARGLGRAAPASSVLPIRSTGTRLPLFCMHNYDCHLMEYRDLARLLGPDRPVYGLLSPALHTARGATPPVETLAREYLADIKRIQPKGPYHLCGNCFGGLIAFEVAQRLRRAGEEVALLALIDTAFPRTRLGRFVHRLSPARHLSALARLPWGGRLRYLADRLRALIDRLGGAKRTAPEAADEAPQEANPHRGAIARYRPRRYPDPAVLYCLGQPHNQAGWRSVLGAALEIVELPPDPRGGDVTYLIQEPYVQRLAADLSARLGD